MPEEVDARRMFHMLYQRLPDKEKKDDERYARIEEKLSIVMSKLSSGEEWVELREWVNRK